jgi:hypothetical protein
MRLARAPGGLSMTAPVVLAAAAHAEVDTDVANQSHTDGIYERDASDGEQFHVSMLHGPFCPRQLTGAYSQRDV